MDFSNQYNDNKKNWLRSSENNLTNPQVNLNNSVMQTNPFFQGINAGMQNSTVNASIDTPTVNASIDTPTVNSFFQNALINSLLQKSKQEQPEKMPMPKEGLEWGRQRYSQEGYADRLWNETPQKAPANLFNNPILQRLYGYRPIEFTPIEGISDTTNNVLRHLVNMKNAYRADNLQDRIAQAYFHEQQIANRATPTNTTLKDTNTALKNMENRSKVFDFIIKGVEGFEDKFIDTPEYEKIKAIYIQTGKLPVKIIKEDRGWFRKDTWTAYYGEEDNQIVSQQPSQKTEPQKTEPQSDKNTIRYYQIDDDDIANIYNKLGS